MVNLAQCLFTTLVEFVYHVPGGCRGGGGGGGGEDVCPSSQAFEQVHRCFYNAYYIRVLWLKVASSTLFCFAELHDNKLLHTAIFSPHPLSPKPMKRNWFQANQDLNWKTNKKRVGKLTSVYVDQNRYCQTQEKQPLPSQLGVRQGVKSQPDKARSQREAEEGLHLCWLFCVHVCHWFLPGLWPACFPALPLPCSCARGWSVAGSFWLLQGSTGQLHNVLVSCVKSDHAYRLQYGYVCMEDHHQMQVLCTTNWHSESNKKTTAKKHYFVFHS